MVETNNSLAAARRYGTPVEQTAEGKERERTFFETLGRFVVRFADVEGAVSLTLWRYAKTPRAVSLHVFASTRIDQGSTLIKQLALATGASQEKRDDLAYVLQQLGVINGVRNSILHHGVDSIAEGAAKSSNWLKAKEAPFEIPVPPEHLEQMIADLNKITLHLLFNHSDRPKPLAPENRAIFDQTLRRAWLYKFPAQKPAPAKKTESRSRKGQNPKSPDQPPPSEV